MEEKNLMIGIFVYFNCFDGASITVKITGFKDNIVYGVSGESSHWCTIEKVEPIPLTPEILEKNGFKKDGFTNLSADYYYSDEACSVCINLNSTCDKSKSIWAENRNSKVSVSIEEHRHSMQKKPLSVHQLQYAIRFCGAEKEIIL